METTQDPPKKLSLHQQLIRSAPNAVPIPTSISIWRNVNRAPHNFFLTPPRIEVLTTWAALRKSSQQLAHGNWDIFKISNLLLPIISGLIVAATDVVFNYVPYKLGIIARTERGLKNIKWRDWRTYYGGAFACLAASGPSLGAALLINQMLQSCFKEQSGSSRMGVTVKDFFSAFLSGAVGEGFFYAHVEQFITAKHIGGRSTFETVKAIKSANNGGYPYLSYGASAMALRGIIFYTGLLILQPEVKALLKKQQVHHPFLQSFFAACINAPIMTALSQIPASIATRQMEYLARVIEQGKDRHSVKNNSMVHIFNTVGARALFFRGLPLRIVSIVGTLTVYDFFTPPVTARCHQVLSHYTDHFKC